jgi:hypothetical protein
MNKKSGEIENIDEKISEKEKSKLQKKQILLGIILGLITGVLMPIILPLIYGEEPPPRFSLVNPYINPRDSLIIVAENEPAMKNENLNVEFDRLKFIDGGQIISKSSPQKWYFSLEKSQIPIVFFEDRTHRIRVGFKGQSLSEELNVYFNSNLPYSTTKDDTPSQPDIPMKQSKPSSEEKETLIFDQIKKSFDIGSPIALSRNKIFDAQGKIDPECHGGRYWFCFVSKDRVWPRDYLKQTELRFSKQLAIPQKFEKGKIVLACITNELHVKYNDWVFGKVTAGSQSLPIPIASNFKIVMESFIIIID